MNPYIRKELLCPLTGEYCNETVLNCDAYIEIEEQFQIEQTRLEIED